MVRKIGAHVSASGGLYKAIERAHEIGANCAQIFSGSPRVWKRKDLSDFDTDKLFSKIKELNVSPIFTHSLYLVNLASDKEDLLRKSFDVLKYDLEFDAMIHGSGIVVHLGSHTGRGWEAVREQVAQQIAQLISQTPENSTFLIENSAGQKGKLCSELSEIRWLLERVAEILSLKNGFGPNGSSRLGWCVDTCHAHAAGYSLGEAQEGAQKSLVSEIEAFDLWDTLKCIHVNDSRDTFGSGRDRHENLGEGNIPKADLQAFLNYKKARGIPIITEVPGFDKKGPDAPNIEYLKNICEE